MGADSAPRWTRRAGDGAIALLPAFLLVKALAVSVWGVGDVIGGQAQDAAAVAIALGAGEIGILVMMWRHRNPSEKGQPLVHVSDGATINEEADGRSGEESPVLTQELVSVRSSGAVAKQAPSSR